MGTERHLPAMLQPFSLERERNVGNPKFCHQAPGTAPHCYPHVKAYLLTHIHTSTIDLGNALPQHHCRRCGKAVCDSCSKHQLPLPVMGYEFPVRMCKECFPALTDDDRHTRCKRYPSQQPVVQMRVLDYAGDIFLLTCGSDKTIKVGFLDSSFC